MGGGEGKHPSSRCEHNRRQRWRCCDNVSVTTVLPRRGLVALLRTAPLPNWPGNEGPHPPAGVRGAGWGRATVGHSHPQSPTATHSRPERVSHLDSHIIKTVAKQKEHRVGHCRPQSAPVSRSRPQAARVSHSRPQSAIVTWTVNSSQTVAKQEEHRVGHSRPQLAPGSRS